MEDHKHDKVHDHTDSCNCGHDHDERESRHKHTHEHGHCRKHAHSNADSSISVEGLNIHVHIHMDSEKPAGCSCECEGHDHSHEGHDHSHEGHDHGDHDHVHVEDIELKPGEYQLEKNTHDEASVISGKIVLYTEKEEAGRVLAKALEKIGADITAAGGIIGHIKAAVEATTMDMYSVTDVENSVKSTPKQDIVINLASIVFLITPDQAEEIVKAGIQDLLSLD